MSYRDFYHMQAEAFGSLPVLNLFYGARTHQDGWRYLLRGIAAREPFLLVSGDYGMGKTMLSMMLVRLLKKKDILLAHITDPHCGFSGILRRTAALLGIDARSLDDESLLTEIYASYNLRADRRVIPVIIDDAQEMSVESLVRLRAFANLNYDGFFPVQLIFFAHPSFASVLKEPGLAAMDQRIKRRHRLTPLTLQETREYIYFRLVKSGAPGAPFFDDDALREIHSATGGVPRLINNLCDASLTRGASRLETCITLATVRDAQADQEGSCLPTVTRAARPARTEEPVGFSAPPVLVSQPRQADPFSSGRASLHVEDTEEYDGPAEMPETAAAPQPEFPEQGNRAVPAAEPCIPSAQAAQHSRARGLWLPVTAAVVVSALAVFFLLRFLDTDVPAGHHSPRDMPSQAAVQAAPGPAAPAEAVAPVQESAQDVAAVAAAERGVPAAPVLEADTAAPAEAVAPVQESAQDVAAVAAAERGVPAAPVLEADTAPPAEAVVSAEESGQDAAAVVAADIALSAAAAAEDLFGSSMPVSDEARPHTLRLGCFKSPETARVASGVYARRALEPFVARVRLPEQGDWYIFYAGSFASNAEALRARERIGLLEADSIPMPYACRIGIFQSAEFEESLLAAVRELGCIPYAIENEDGTVSLFAGLYRNRSNADLLRKALADSDIVSSVVLLRAGGSESLQAGPAGAAQDSQL